MMNCIYCEGTLSVGRCTRCGRNGSMAGPAVRGNAVTWPFYQPGLLANLWMPLAASFLWPFGLLIGLGWSVDAIGRRARSDSQLSPRTKDLASILKHGFVVLTMYALYFMLPLAMIFKLIEFSWFAEVWHLIVAIAKSILHTNQEPLWSIFLRFLGRLATNAVVPVIYVAFASPLFLAARLRYAITGKVRSFFNLPANIMFCFRYVGEMLLYLFLAAITRIALAAILALLAPTVIGVIIPLLLGAANIWILAYFAGNLSRGMCEPHGVEVRPPLVQQSFVSPALADHFPLGAQLEASKPYELRPPGINRINAAAEHQDQTPLQEAPVAFAPKLYCRMGPLHDKFFSVATSGYFIGRSPSVSQVIVSLREVSSQHVRVEADPYEGGVWIEDMNSTNGTYYCFHSEPWQRLNGRIRLPNGGRFRLSKDAAEFEVRGG